MMKYFTALAAATLATSISGSAQSATTDQDPRHLKYQGVINVAVEKQIDVTEYASQARFETVTEKAAVFVNSKTAETSYMRCEEAVVNRAIAGVNKAPKSFKKELDKAIKSLNCTGPSI